jgi:predicted amidohydrolase YtcJ
MITLYKNGNIHTMDNVNPGADTIIVNENKFAYVGTQAGAEKYMESKGKADKVVDLAGRLVIPGLNDSHMHFVHFAKSLKSVNLSGTKSIGEIKERVLERINSRDQGDKTWIEGEGWNHDYFLDEKRFPTKFDLDEVSTEIPILVVRACCHVGSLNTAGMNAFGINKETAPSYGNLIGLLPNGEPDGTIKESLLDTVKSKISTLNLESLKDIIDVAQHKALAQGLTSVQSDDVGYTPNYDYDLLFQAFRELDEVGKLHIRIGEQCSLFKKPTMEGFFNKGYKYGFGTDKYRVNCLKLFTDGSLGARSALLRNPYADDSSTKGIQMFSQEELDEVVMFSHSNNCPVAIHAIGDGAIVMCLDSIEKAQKAYPEIHLRHGIVHCQITDSHMIDRFKELGVLAFVQPIFIDYDINIIEDRVGAELAKTSYAWKTMIDKGIHLSLGTDCPVEAFNTMPNIYSAVARKNITGENKRVYLPNERLSMNEAIHAYTYEGAYAAGEENVKGTISKGKLADFIVLDKDLFNLQCDEEILDTHVVETYVDGQLVYTSN